MSYIGLFSYYSFDNWAYQPSYVSSNTPSFFNGFRVQWFPTNKLKFEPWLINGGLVSNPGRYLVLLPPIVYGVPGAITKEIRSNWASRSGARRFSGVRGRRISNHCASRSFRVTKASSLCTSSRERSKSPRTTRPCLFQR